MRKLIYFIILIIAVFYSSCGTDKTVTRETKSYIDSTGTELSRLSLDIDTNIFIHKIIDSTLTVTYNIKKRIKEEHEKQSNINRQDSVEGSSIERREALDTKRIEEELLKYIRIIGIAIIGFIMIHGVITVSSKFSKKT